MSTSQESQPQPGPQQKRRTSLFERLGDKIASKKAQNISGSSSGPITVSTLPASDDNISTFSGETITSRTGLFNHRESSTGAVKAKKPRRERISDNGPFKLVVDPVTGVSRLVENNRWPPGVEYETPNRLTKNQGLDDWYTKRGAIVGGGDGAANNGPDPDWIPGLSKEEREKVKKEKGGWYVF
jgi:hypothetical protein